MNHLLKKKVLQRKELTDLEQRRLTGIERRATARKAMFEQYNEAQNGGIKARSGKDKKGKKKKYIIYQLPTNRFYNQILDIL